MTEILHSTTFPKIYQNSDLYQESCIYIPILKKNVAKFCILQLLLETQLEKDLTALQLLRVLHGIIIISSLQEGLQPGLFSENLVFGEISHFTTFARILVFKPYKTIGQFCNSLLYHSIIATTKLLRKPGFRAIFRKTCSFNRRLVYFP